MIDCIGGEDGFVCRLLPDWDGQRFIQYVWATGAMDVTMLEDCASPQNVHQVWNMWKCNARVVR